MTWAYPGKVSELIQYNHIIYTASLSFIWDNVYLYNKEFRLHISKFPQRSWCIILWQAWSMYLKDRIKAPEEQKGGKHSKSPGEPCRRFNKGKCSYGASCIYDHRCAVKRCGKYGHGAHICWLCDSSKHKVIMWVTKAPHNHVLQEEVMGTTHTNIDNLISRETA